MVGEQMKALRKKARELRNNMTRAEIILWSRIKSRQINGFKFRRQYPVLDYIADFYCHDLKLIIEVDGEIHNLHSQRNADIKRDKMLKNNGYYVLHFNNHEIETDLQRSVSIIKQFTALILSRNVESSESIDK